MSSQWFPNEVIMDKKSTKARKRKEEKEEKERMQLKLKTKKHNDGCAIDKSGCCCQN